MLCVFCIDSITSAVAWQQAANDRGSPFKLLRGYVCAQADVALAPFFERFRLCLQLTQDYDLSAEGGSMTAWLVGS